ncbi:MAG TPA: hypothetical protein VIQ28_04535 [Burkholderiales bacterium]|jgi:Bacterial protein of unknown function (DUF883).
MEFNANEQAIRENGRYEPDQVAPHAAGLLKWLYGLRERAHDVGSIATRRRVDDARDAAGTYIHRYPFGTVTLAFAVGFVAGVLIARR